MTRMRRSEHESAPMDSMAAELVEVGKRPEIAGEVFGTKLTRAQRGFFLLVGVSVVFLSFAYGISVGLKKPRHWAYARPDVWESPLDEEAQAALIAEIGLPAGVSISRTGHHASINDRPATIVNFTTDIPAERILREQIQFWEASGFKVMSKEGNHRGLLIGFDPVSHRKLQMSVWSVPLALRDTLSQGKPVQGSLSLLSDEKEHLGVESDRVPEVPIIPGGKGGAVFRSEEPQGPSYSSVYSNPGSIRDNVDFYRRELGSDGWRERSVLIGGVDAKAGHLTFQRGTEELVLLFSPKTATQGEEKTVVAVFRGPKLEIQKRVF